MIKLYLSLLLSFILFSCNQENYNAKKNVLFIVVDDLKPLLGSYGYNEIISPNIDKLVKKSTAFTSHYAGIVPCGPSRTTMLTGLYPFIHRSVTNGAPLDKRFTNIA